MNLQKVKRPGHRAKDINSFVMCYWVLTKELILKHSRVLSHFLHKLSSLLLKEHDQDQEDMYTFKSVNTLRLSAKVINQKKAFLLFSKSSEKN